MKKNKSLEEWLKELISKYEKSGSNFPLIFMIVPSYQPKNPLFPEEKTANTYVTYQYSNGFWYKRWYHEPQGESINLTSCGITDITIKEIAKKIEKDVGNGFYEVTVSDSCGYPVLEKITTDENLGGIRRPIVQI